MSEQPTRRQRGSATRFDTTRQTIFIIITGVLALILVLALAFLAFQAVISWFPRLALTVQGGGLSQAKEVIPRNIDIWAVYPDDTIRFVTIFYPLIGETDQAMQVDIAGPLMRGPENQIDSQVFGGELLQSEFLPGPGGDQAYVYELYDVSYNAGGEPYGADVKVFNPPYISADGALKTIALGADPQTYYEQMIVAVAFPEVAVIKSIPDLRAYRRAKVEGWTVLYFDTTALEQRETIAVDYMMQSAPVTVADFDYFQVDAAR